MNDPADVDEPARGTAEERSFDDTRSVLADHERRHLLAVLQDLETPERVPALVRNLAVATGRSGTDEIDGLRTRLYDSHIPTLSEAGVIAYDEARNAVELTERGRALASLEGSPDY